MSAMNVSEDIVPIGEFKTHAARWMKHAAASGHPVVITHNGRPAAVMLSPAEYDRLAESDMERFLADIAAGLADADAGRVYTTEEVVHKLAARRAASKAPPR
jgi:prevent-host-death family protein